MNPGNLKFTCHSATYWSVNMAKGGKLITSLQDSPHFTDGQTELWLFSFPNSFNHILNARHNARYWGFKDAKSSLEGLTEPVGEKNDICDRKGYSGDTKGRQTILGKKKLP